MMNQNNQQSTENSQLKTKKPASGLSKSRAGGSRTHTDVKSGGF